jgi:hypothetical protein
MMVQLTPIFVSFLISKELFDNQQTPLYAGDGRVRGHRAESHAAP